MKVPEELLCKFPAILRDKIKNGDLEFPDNTEFKYPQVYAYRCVKRKQTDELAINREDFKSHAELGRKNVKFGINNLEQTPEYYGVSFFKNREELYIRLNLPMKNRKVASGYIYQEGGPRLENTRTTHVCWWLYENVDLSGFKIVEE